ncbi:MAG: patatin-like phospholipase family protein [Verrucomicrobiaceae bacterium]|nr:patatin-like phospholipase family protein [Verrucomicrobiaceae bacterium]
MAACFHFLNPFRSGSGGVSPHPVTAESSPRPRLGIALSSGGAKGLAHVGVIQVLEENGIPIDAIAGTSMGAYVGGLWASGLSGAELEELAASMSGRRELWELVDPAIPRRGFIGGRKVLQRLRRTLGEKTFAELKTPFHCVATELNGYARAVLHEGDVASAILASLAIPGIVAPVVRDGIEYIDGGVCDPLPVDVLRELPSIDKVIAVNVLPKVNQTGSFRESAPKYRIWKNPCAFLNQYLNLFARGNLLDILRGAAMGSQMRLVESSAAHADVLIPAISPMPRWHDYNNYRDYIALGRDAAEGMLPQIWALLEPPEKAGKEEPGLLTSLKKAACV